MTHVEYIPTAREKARAPQPSVYDVIDACKAELKRYDELIEKLEEQINDLSPKRFHDGY